MPILQERFGSDIFVIKKGSGYMTISSPEFKFIDIQFFLAPGYNLSKFLKAYDADDAKSDFPYEYLNSVADLLSNEFPPYDGFYSTLRQVNTLDQEHQHFCGLVQEGFSEEQALRRMGLEEPPLTGIAKYDDLRLLFTNNNWNMSDYLAFYNNLGIVVT